MAGGRGRGDSCRGDAAGRHPGLAPGRVTGCLARAQRTQHTQRARAIRRGDAAGRHPGLAPRRVTGCLARAQHTQRARQFVGAMQPGVILV
ncbi:MAG: hypothetical protein M5U34_08315 [Chloroflexi bacterium]|nr:hypothetical protein [Chloroflexota bacterium]